jgi:hypothetical protein
VTWQCSNTKNRSFRRRSICFALNLLSAAFRVPPQTPHQTTSTNSTSRPPRNLVVKVVPNRTLQLGGTVAQHARQVLEIIAGGDTELANEVFRGSLEIAVVLDASSALLVLGAAEVGVGRNGLGAFEALQACLGFGLRGGVVGAFAKELVGRDALLDAELFAGVALGVVC